MFGVIVKYHGPTDHRGTRLSCRTACGLRVPLEQKFYGYDYSVDLDANMRDVAIRHIGGGFVFKGLLNVDAVSVLAVFEGEV